MKSELIEKALTAYWPDASVMATDSRSRERMAAALQVVADEMLAPISDEEWCLCSGGYPNRRVIDATLANRRQRLLAADEPSDDWPASTCVWCGKHIPSGTQQRCDTGHWCSHVVPFAVREHMERLAALLKDGKQ